MRAAEVTGEERAVVVSAYARRFGWLNGRFFALPRGFRLEDARRVAARHPTFRLTTTLVVVVVVALGLVAPAWAAAARTGYVIGPRALPPDVPTARAELRRALDRAPAGSLTRADIDYVLRLGRSQLRAGQPDGRRRTVARTLRVNAWWYAYHAAPADRVIARDPAVCCSTYWEGRASRSTRSRPRGGGRG